MPSMRGSLALLTAAALAALAVPALAARPAGDTRYRGKTSQDRTINARVTSDSKGLQLEFTERLKCNRGAPRTVTAIYRNQRPTIKADGTFNYNKTYTNLPPTNVFRERSDERQTVTGRFSADGATVTGKVIDVITTRSGLSCRASVTFRAKRR